MDGWPVVLADRGPAESVSVGRVKMLIRLGCQDERCFSSQDVRGCQRRLPRGYSRFDNAPSGGVAKSGVEDLRVGGTRWIRRENFRSSATRTGVSRDPEMDRRG
jgi:hypothetical protein